jgi:hypothetical protein
MPLAQQFLATSLLAVAGLVSAVCDCGFSMTSISNVHETIHFTDVIETNFEAARGDDIMVGWVAQEFNVTAEAGRGEYGKAFLTNNVASLFQGDPRPSELSDEGGVSLRVSSSLQDGAVPSAELDSRRLDLHWGSFRAALKPTTINGTCGAFFWVRSLFLIELGHSEKLRMLEKRPYTHRFYGRLIRLVIVLQ